MPRAAHRSATDPSPSLFTAAVLKALANGRRLEILNWLKDPRAHFPPQADGDLVKDGVCGVFIAQKLNGQPADRERAPADPDPCRPAARETDQAVDVLPAG